MPTVAVIADTHVPSRATEIPEWVHERVAAADYTIHAGDFDSPEAYETVAELAGDAFTAVVGNMDPGELGLPEVETATIDDVTFVITHGTGDLETYEERVAETVTGVDEPEPVVGISAHTHQVMDREVDGVHLLNPGSATGADPASDATMLTVDVEGAHYEPELHTR